MARRWKLTLVAAGALAGLVAIGAATASFFLQESRLAAAASKELGMDVGIGEATIALSPGLHLRVKNLQVRNRGVDLVSAELADFGIDLLPLFLLDVRFNEATLERYRISIERDAEGTLNYQRTESREERRSFDLSKAVLSDGSLQYTNQASGRSIVATDCDLDVSHVSHPGGNATDRFSPKLAITMQFVCGQLTTEDLVFSDLQGALEGKDGVFEVDPVTMLVLGAHSSGSVQVDRSEPLTKVHARYEVPEFDIGELLKTVSPENVASGPVAFQMDLRMQGETWDELRQTAEGTASLMGQNLTLHGRDLDRDFKRYKSIQSFNLVDLGGLFLAGPLGLAVTKGYSFASIFRGSEGETAIRKLVSEWEVEGGVAHAKDVALTTNECRLALRGGLDFAREEFQDVTVALLDPDGCVYVRQKISGPFGKPVVEKPFFLKTIAGPVLNLFQRIRKLFPHEECEVFYAGSLEHPTPPEKSKKKD